MRYFVYCRKSSESEDRQVLSIESQQSELQRAFGDQRDMMIVGIYHEAFSAKAPGRAKFTEMLTRIERGEADGIIAWHPDRLARNSIDGGSIIYLLDQKKLKDLRFSTFTFENNPQGKFMLSIIFGYSKYYVDSLSENVKRGNRTKVENGWRPNMAPLGYRNDKETKTIIRDPAHFPLIRKMYEFMLTGTYLPKEIALIARDEWGFRTPVRKRVGGKPLALSTVYRILTNPFYAGIIEWDGNVYQGKHEPVVTLKEFDRVQEILGRPGRPQPQKHTFAFTGMIRCGECSLMVTAEHKVNRFGSHYVYYHCTKRRIGTRCPQPSIEVRELERQVLSFLEEITLPEELYTQVLELEDESTDRADLQKAKKRSIARALSETEAQLSELTGLRTRRLISDEEFVAERRRLQGEQIRLSEPLAKYEENDNSFEPVKDIALFRSRAIAWFTVGDDKDKRLILETTGSNLMLRDKILNIEARKPFTRLPEMAGNSRLLALVKNIRTLRERQDSETAMILHNIKMLNDKFQHQDGDPQQSIDHPLG